MKIESNISLRPLTQNLPGSRASTFDVLSEKPTISAVINDILNFYRPQADLLPRVRAAKPNAGASANAAKGGGRGHKGGGKGAKGGGKGRKGGGKGSKGGGKQGNGKGGSGKAKVVICWNCQKAGHIQVPRRNGRLRPAEREAGTRSRGRKRSRTTNKLSYVDPRNGVYISGGSLLAELSTLSCER